MSSQIAILGITGSLRAESFNTKLLRAAIEIAPPGVTIHLYEGLAELPVFDEDLGVTDPPPPVVDLRRRITDADALLIASPEYNYSIPGGLKNAIDWASLPAGVHCLRHKPVAIMGASIGNFGTARAQLALRQVFLCTESIPTTRPEVHVFRAHERFDGDGNLVDRDTRALVEGLIGALCKSVESETNSRHDKPF